MKRRQFLTVFGGAVSAGGLLYYFSSDRSNLVRSDMDRSLGNTPGQRILADEQEILYLASLAPSGHNTQPWFVTYVEPYHWIIGNDKTKWLPAVDPTQRETILSIGAFVQNLEYAAENLGYTCQFTMLAHSNQDENIMEVKLLKTGSIGKYDVQKIKQRRTVRSDYLSQSIKKSDLDYLIGNEPMFFHFIPNTSKAYGWLNEQTIEANRIQSYRDKAQQELAEWIRFSSKDARQHCDGLTTASMEIAGLPGWILRNFYTQKSVLKNDFREKGIDKVKEQVSQSAGWLLITSKDNATTTLLETGMRMQRLFLKIRDKHIAIHPMTQLLEEKTTDRSINASLGVHAPIQFLLRVGYLDNYPAPVSLRRPVEKFVRNTQLL